MFSKNGYKLKSDFRKIFSSTNEVFQDPIKPEESKSISFMWSKIFGDNAIVIASRFRRQKIHLGFRISTTSSDKGYKHMVIDVVDNSDISQNTHIKPDDILLEVNGVNLLQLNYAELSILLGSLPMNVQIVYLKKENEYEKIEGSHEDKNNLKKYKGGWMHSVNIIVQGSRKMSEGLEFINNTFSKKNISRCVIQRINLNGYFSQDKRVSVNDSILKINEIEVQNYQDKDMYKFFLSNKSSGFLLCIGKYNQSYVGSNYELGTVERCQSSLQGNVAKSNEDLLRKRSNSQTIKTTFLKEPPTEKSVGKGCQSLSFQVNKSDDLGIYLVDIKDFLKSKSIICGFHEDSKLKSKFQMGDEIIQINDEEVISYSSLEIGKLLKKFHGGSEVFTVTVLRNPKPFKFNKSIIILPDPVVPDSSQESTENTNQHFTFNVTLEKVNNSFGLFIQNCEGPTIKEVSPESEIYKKDLVRPGDKIVRINDIYVLNKEKDFVLTLIRSCGKTMHLEMMRNIETDKSIECTTNSVYSAESFQDSESQTSEQPKKIAELESKIPSSQIPKIKEYLTKPEIKVL